ncbi:MAG: AMP-binding protein, partial [Gammaproteobacteria bacterium]
MSEEKLYPVFAEAAANTHLTEAQYRAMYDASIADPESFWAEQARSTLTWSTPFSSVVESNLREGQAKWFADGSLNVTVNCIDRHLPDRADQAAIIWEGDEPTDSLTITYSELSTRVNVMANILKSRGVKKGDRVCIYMPMIPEAAYAMLACARIGAIHSVVFGGFSPGALRDRILDANCESVITADEGVRGGKTIPLKHNVDLAVEECPNVHTVLVVPRTGADMTMVPERDVDYAAAAINASDDCPPEAMNAEDPLFILYTSGSTGKPKGVLHTTAGYLLGAAMTHRYVFDYKDGDIYWCTADVGWVTGHSYIVYGPLANGAVTLMFEGVPTYPDAGRFWQIIDKHAVNIFYTAPTALRSLMSLGDDFVTKSSRSSLRLLGSVG